ncbi:MAG: hypothetical protein IJH36_13080 [Clostridia bacterium]|nr:hypothetical protein [Clostridia bacterium]
MIREMKEKICSFCGHRDADIAGVFIWQFCDTRVKMDAKRTMCRAKSRNNKGLVDEYRRPKLAYYVVRDLFGEK